MTEDQIKHMVDRFLSWKLPENFNPDGGITFKAAFNEHTAYPMKHEPSGTNLFDAEQTKAMVRYMVEGLPQAERDEIEVETIERALEPLNKKRMQLHEYIAGIDPTTGESRQHALTIAEGRLLQIDLDIQVIRALSPKGNGDV